MFYISLIFQAQSSYPRMPAGVVSLPRVSARVCKNELEWGVA